MFLFFRFSMQYVCLRERKKLKNACHIATRSALSQRNHLFYLHICCIYHATIFFCFSIFIFGSFYLLSTQYLTCEMARNFQGKIAQKTDGQSVRQTQGVRALRDGHRVGQSEIFHLFASSLIFHRIISVVLGYFLLLLLNLLIHFHKRHNIFYGLCFRFCVRSCESFQRTIYSI